MVTWKEIDNLYTATGELEDRASTKHFRKGIRHITTPPNAVRRPDRYMAGSIACN